MQFCCDGTEIIIGALRFHPYTVPHDAREPLQYVASNGHHRLGILTDAGHASTRVHEALGACDALLLECNHDRRLLSDSAYPYSLKQRVGGDYGHLSNEAATALLLALDQSRLQTIVGAHLSRQNNTRELALAAIVQGVKHSYTQVHIADQDAGFFWIDLGTQGWVLSDACENDALLKCH